MNALKICSFLKKYVFLHNILILNNKSTILVSLNNIALWAFNIFKLNTAFIRLPLVRIRLSRFLTENDTQTYKCTCSLDIFNKSILRLLYSNTI